MIFKALVTFIIILLRLAIVVAAQNSSTPLITDGTEIFGPTYPSSCDVFCVYSFIGDINLCSPIDKEDYYKACMCDYVYYSALSECAECIIKAGPASAATAAQAEVSDFETLCNTTITLRSAGNRAIQTSGTPILFLGTVLLASPMIFFL